MPLHVLGNHSRNKRLRRTIFDTDFIRVNDFTNAFLYLITIFDRMQLIIVCNEYEESSFRTVSNGPTETMMYIIKVETNEGIYVINFFISSQFHCDVELVYFNEQQVLDICHSTHVWREPFIEKRLLEAKAASNQESSKVTV